METPTVPYILMQDRLSTGGSFLLCDANSMGFPIRYASQGFADLFGYYASECLDRKCGDLVAPKSMLNGPALQHLAQVCDMNEAEVKEGIQILNEHIAEECRLMMKDPSSKVGFALVVNQKKDGTVFVCEVVMNSHRHPFLGWTYTIGLQSDVTTEVPFKDLLQVALCRQCSKFMSSRRVQMERRLEHLGINGDDAVNYLNQKSAEMWQSWMASCQSHPEKQMQKGCGASGKVSLHTLNTRSTVDAKSEDGLSRVRESESDDESFLDRETLQEHSETTSSYDSTEGQSSVGESVRPRSGFMSQWKGYKSITGKWHGKVSEVIGGYEQEMEFHKDGTTVYIQIMGKTVTGKYVLDCSKTPHFLDLTLPNAATDNCTIDCLAPAVPCIVKFQGKELHLCCPCSAAMHRPETFEGPGYCLMRSKEHHVLDTPKEGEDTSDALDAEETSTGPTSDGTPVTTVEHEVGHPSTKIIETEARIGVSIAVAGAGLLIISLLAWRRRRQC